jgi:thymidylate synthase
MIKGLREHPNSRRLVMTTWNPYDMAHITELNKNPKTPSCCHGSFIQCFVRHGELHLSMVQRSADMLLGVPHNWCQYWALLLYFAHHSNYRVGSFRWIGMDCHIYQHVSHIETVDQLLQIPQKEVDNRFNLCYTPSVKTEGVPEFKAADFVMEGTIPEPQVFTRPKLL